MPFVSPLVLRREIETLLTTDFLALSDSSIRSSHPVIFWNLIYYLRRLDVATHIYTWISKNVHIRCVYDRPEKHNIDMLPIYLTNHVVSYNLKIESSSYLFLRIGNLLVKKKIVAT